MQSNEQLYRDQVQQDDFFNADLADAHLRTEAAERQSSPNTSSNLAEQFMQTLQQTEATGAVEPLVALFAETADLSNLAMSQPIQGREAIQQFWQHYLSVFDRIHSRFTHTSEGNGTITLEWISEGALASGEPICYRGVSILEVQDDQVQHFRTYYDSASFLPEGAKQ